MDEVIGHRFKALAITVNDLTLGLLVRVTLQAGEVCQYEKMESFSKRRYCSLVCLVRRLKGVWIIMLARFLH